MQKRGELISDEGVPIKEHRMSIAVFLRKPI